MTRHEKIQELAVVAARDLEVEAKPAIRRALAQLRQIPEFPEACLLDLQDVLARLDIAVTRLIGPDEGRLEILQQTSVRIGKANERKAARKGAVRS